MKKNLVLSLIALFLFSCSAIPKEQICSEPMNVVGTVIYATSTPHKTRTIYYKTSHGNMIIYNVPTDVNTIVIPICFGNKGQAVYYKNK